MREPRIFVVDDDRRSIGKKSSDLESSSSLELGQQTAESLREGWIRISNIKPRVLANRNPDLQRDWENPN